MRVCVCLVMTDLREEKKKKRKEKKNKRVTGWNDLSSHVYVLAFEFNLYNFDRCLLGGHDKNCIICCNTNITFKKNIVALALFCLKKKKEVKFKLLNYYL